uniref:NADH dehydrogenase subunit 6 n=1 Tax=Eulepethus nanhaiensis TaxID=1881687 RepID=A0A343W6F9_9ANNE|nr:NADH dehydrogenase subunit 6 [Eulepethus nanhaiensis]
MSLWIIISFTMSISFSTILANSPLSIGLWVLLLALMVAISTSFIFPSWFAFIIFLIYIGGMLVMFSYFTALTPNQPLEMKKMCISLILTLFLIMMILFSSPILNTLLSTQWTSSSNPISILFTSYNTTLLLFLASILFLALVAVVKITNLPSGPLRSFLYV